MGVEPTKGGLGADLSAHAASDKNGFSMSVAQPASSPGTAPRFQELYHDNRLCGRCPQPSHLWFGATLWSIEVILIVPYYGL